MSIKGIDAQMMITRLPDNVKEASAIQKRPEVMQDVLAYREKINDAEVQSRVARTTETEMEGIRTDVEEEGGGAYYGERGPDREKDGQNDEPGPDMIVPPGNYTIDITI